MVKKALLFDKGKFKAVILYLISLYPNNSIEGKKRLAKLLYFIDFNFFELFETPLTGAHYCALPMGPVPNELDVTLEELAKKEIQISKKSIGLSHDIVVYKLKVEKEKLLESIDLSDKERAVIDKVFKDLGNLNGKELEIMTHAEAPFNAVTQYANIPYELAFYRGKTKDELIQI